MGSALVSAVEHKEQPRVGLLNNGTEEAKGSALTKAAHQLLQASGLHYTGYTEARDVFSGAADVIVTDGFTGNVIIKLSEGVSRLLMDILKTELTSRSMSKVGALLARPAFDAVRGRLDYREYGGAPLLGIDGVVIVGHGRSDALAVENAVRVAIDAVNNKVVEAISAEIAAAQAHLDAKA